MQGIITGQGAVPPPLGFTFHVPPGRSPLLVLVNPKSGGCQGVALLAEFQWQLNPRQVFNIMARDGPGGGVAGPGPGLKL